MCLPFELCSAPKLSNILTDLLSWVLRKRGDPSLYYLDNFLIFGLTASNLCQLHLNVVKEVCESPPGTPLAFEKVEWPPITLTFLGITLDTVCMKPRLPADKLDRIKRWLPHSYQKRKQLNAKFFHKGASFSMQQKLSEPRLNKQCCSDLSWWHLFLASCNS